MTWALTGTVHEFNQKLNGTGNQVHWYRAPFISVFRRRDASHPVCHYYVSGGINKMGNTESLARASGMFPINRSFNEPFPEVPATTIVA